MLGLSRALNPECEHLAGDTRTLPLGRTFDAVLVHDAIGPQRRDLHRRVRLPPSRGGSMRSVHCRHLEGLFARETWLRILSGAGYLVETFARPLDDETLDEVFLCRRRG
jgi:hypothetical protein